MTRRIGYLIFGVGFLAQIVSYAEDAGIGIDDEVLAGDTATDDLVSDLRGYRESVTFLS